MLTKKWTHEFLALKMSALNATNEKLLLDAILINRHKKFKRWFIIIYGYPDTFLVIISF